MTSPLNSTFKGPKLSTTATVTSGPVNLDGTIETLNVDATAGNVVVNLPLISNTTGLPFTVRKIDSSANTVTVTATTPDQIQGVSTVVLSLQWDAVSLSNDGTQWYKAAGSGGGSGALSGLTASQVLFATGTTTVGGDSALIWNNISKFLGIGGAPSQALQITNGNILVNSANSPTISAQTTGTTQFAGVYALSDAGGVTIQAFGSAYTGATAVGRVRTSLNLTGGLQLVSASATNGISFWVNNGIAVDTLAASIAPTTYAANFVGSLTSGGVIQSTSGGFKFPDNTTQTTAAVGGSGTATQVAYFSGTTTLTSNSGLLWDTTYNRLLINSPSAVYGALQVRSKPFQDTVGNGMGTSDWTSAVIWDNTTAYNASPHTGIMFMANIDTTPLNAYLGGIQWSKENTSVSDAGSYFSLSTRPAGLNTGTSTTERLRINSVGRVLIGTPVDDTNALLQVSGKIESKSGGFIFPDGTTQITAASGGGTLSGGTVNAVPFWATASSLGNSSMTYAAGTGFAISNALTVAGATGTAGIGLAVGNSTQTQALLLGPTLSSPVNAAFTTGVGSLTTGTYYYRVSATNAIGETLPSTETSIAVTSLTTPVNAAFTAGTGTLAAGTYYYRVSATNAQGETLASAETSFALTATGGINVNWGAVTGATGYKVYGRSTGAELLIASVGAVTTYLDNGSVTPAGALPTSNTTTLGINVNWGAVAQATGYKVYGRSTGAELLIASVGNVTTYLDNGSITPAGAMPTTNITSAIKFSDGTIQTTAPASWVGGSGTTNTIPFWSGATTLAASIVGIFNGSYNVPGRIWINGADDGVTALQVLNAAASAAKFGTANTSVEAFAVKINHVFNYQDQVPLLVVKGYGGSTGTTTALGTPYIQAGGSEETLGSYYTVGFGAYTNPGPTTGGQIRRPPIEIGAITTLVTPGYANNSVADLIFATRTVTGNYTATEKMRLTAPGRLLIGTTTDDTNALLQVNGVIESKTGGVLFPDAKTQLVAGLGQGLGNMVPYLVGTTPNVNGASIVTMGHGPAIDVNTVVHFNLDDSGSTSADSGPNNLTLTVNGTVPSGTGMINGSRTTSTSGCLISAQPSEVLVEAFRTGGWAVGMWFKPYSDANSSMFYLNGLNLGINDSDTSMLAFLYDNASQRPYLYNYITHNTYDLQSTGGQIYFGPSGCLPHDSQFHYVLVTCTAPSGGNITFTFYIDGVQTGTFLGTAKSTVTALTGTYHFGIGGYRDINGTYNLCHADFDDVWVMNRTPSAAEALEIYANAKSGQQLVLQPADTSNPGIVSITTQNFTGTKSFNKILIGTTTDTGQLLQVNGTSALNGQTNIGSTSTHNASLYINGHVGLGLGGLGDKPSLADTASYASLWFANGASIHGEDNSAYQGVFFASNEYRTSAGGGWAQIDATRPTWLLGLSAGSSTDYFDVTRYAPGGNINTGAGAYTAIHVNASGHVLMGTATDDGSGSILQVVGKIKSTTGGFVFPDGTTQATTASGNTSSSGTNNQLAYFTGTNTLASSPNFVINTTNGWFGVGKTPGSAFEVAGTVNVDNAMSSVATFFNSGDAYSVSPKIGFALAVKGDTTGTFIDVGGIVAGKENAVSADGKGYVALVSRNNFVTGPAEGLRVNSSQRVLIGTTADDTNALLQVNGKIESKTGGFLFPDGTTQTTAVSGGTLSGGTTNVVPYWTSATTLGNSSMTYTATGLAVGNSISGQSLGLLAALSTPVNSAFTQGLGSLATGTYYYRVTATSTFGETLPSTETSFSITALSTPINAAFTAGAGTLAAGTYYYRVTATNAQGETLASTETSFVLTAAGGVNVNWGAVTGATGYKVYGRSTGAELLIASVGAVTTYLDNGSITPAGAMPTVNTTGGGVNVNWGAVTGATGYKVYGRIAGGELLIGTVTGNSTTTFLDNNSVTPAGALPTVNNTSTIKFSDGTIQTTAGLPLTGGTVSGASTFSSNLNINGSASIKGGITSNRTAVADTNYTALSTDFIIAYTSITVQRTITLPSAGPSNTGQLYVIKDESGSVTGTVSIVVTPSTGTIDGVASVSITTARGVLRVYSNGSNWFTY